MLLPEGMEDSASTKRNVAGRKARFVNSEPPLEKEPDRSADEDTQSSKSDETQESVVDSISVATDTSSGTESPDDVLQGQKPASHPTLGSCRASLRFVRTRNVTYYPIYLR